MTEPVITCPKCMAEIKLNESLAGPLIEATRKDYEQRMTKKDADITKREAALAQERAALESTISGKLTEERSKIAKREEELTREKAALESKISGRVDEERAKIAAEEARKAKLAIGTELQLKETALADANALLKERDTKLAEAQKVQADLLKKQRELDDQKRELDLTIEKRIQSGLSDVREQAKRDVEESMKLKVSEKEQLISSLQTRIDDLQRRAEQGSQQLQGEVQELELEAALRAKFPHDAVEPVPKGEYGGDALQRVTSPMAQKCGTILWESKRTKNWSDGWLPKLRDDQRAAKADLAVIVTQVLPKDIESFGFIDGIWIVHPRVALPVALILRQSLIDVTVARLSSDGLQTKTEMLYSYLTGPRFRQRVQAIVEAFSGMKEDLEKERRAITKQWAKREEQIDRVMTSTVGMYGDMQGIAGKSLQEIEGLEMKALETAAVVVSN